MQVRCFTCGNVIEPLARHLDKELDKTFLPLHLPDEELLDNPNKRALDTFHLKRCCRMRIMSFISLRKQYQGDYHQSGSSLKRAVFPDLPKDSYASEMETVGFDMRALGATVIRYEAPRTYTLRNMPLFVSNFLRQVLTDEMWVVGFSQTDDECAQSTNVRCVDNNDTLRNVLRTIPLTVPVPEESITTLSALRAHYQTFCETYKGYLFDAHNLEGEIHIVTSQALLLKRTETKAVDMEMTRKVIPRCQVGAATDRPIGLTALQSRILLSETPRIECPEISMVLVKPIWHKSYSLFSQILFEPAPDEAAIESRLRELNTIPEEEARAAAIELFNTEERKLLHREDETNVTLMMVAPYFTYEFAWKMVRQIAKQRLTYFRDKILPTIPVHVDKADMLFTIILTDSHFDTDEPVGIERTLAYPTHIYAFLVSSWFFHTYRPRAEPSVLDVLYSTVREGHMENRDIPWLIGMVDETITVDQLRSLIQEALTRLVELIDTFRLS